MSLTGFNRMRRALASSGEAAAVAAAPLGGGIPDDGFGDVDELRAAITAASGKAPHHKLGRARLVEMMNAIRAARQEEAASNGLTRREIEADLESLGAEFDPRDDVEALAALRDKAKAEAE